MPYRVQYVCGFMVEANRSMVAMVRKSHPDWQKGRLNGVGGVVGARQVGPGEPPGDKLLKLAGETPRQAMVREFEEETGQATFESDWSCRVELEGKDWRVYFYLCLNAGYDLSRLKAPGDEPVEIVNPYQLPRGPRGVVPNLHWILPLCLDGTLRYPVRVEDVSEPALGKMPQSQAGGPVNQAEGATAMLKEFRARERRDGAGALVGWAFQCPACRQEHLIPAGRWQMTGTAELPTFEPSFKETVNGKDSPDYQPQAPTTVCHCTITNGAIFFHPDCTHPMAGASGGLLPVLTADDKPAG